MYGLFLMGTGRAHVFGIDTVRTNQMPNLSNLYQAERTARLVDCIQLVSNNNVVTHQNFCMLRHYLLYALHSKLNTDMLTQNFI